MRVELHPCYILHQRPYRETSLLIDVLSRDHGRVSLVAKGAKRQRSPQRFVLQPMRSLNLAWTMRSELGTLTHAEAAGVAPELSADGLMSAFYVNELLMRLLHRHEPHPELFSAYAAVLAALSQTEGAESALRVFEKRLLVGLGYGLVLDHDVETGAALAFDGDYYFDVEKGPTKTPRAAAQTIRISGVTLDGLIREQLDGELQLGEAKRLMRTVLGLHLGAKPLSSRELYRKFLSERQREHIRSE